MPFSTRCMRPEDWAELKHFTPAEFTKPLVLGYEFMKWLDEVREAAGVVMLVSSSYRTPEHNAAVGGAGDSAHTEIPCDAVDIRKNPKTAVTWNHDRFRIVRAAIAHGCQRIGIYQDDSIHLDRTEDVRPAPRLWIRV
jgi:hypothetical protein